MYFIFFSIDLAPRRAVSSLGSGPNSQKGPSHEMAPESPTLHREALLTIATSELLKTLSAKCGPI